MFVHNRWLFYVTFLHNNANSQSAKRTLIFKIQTFTFKWHCCGFLPDRMLPKEYVKLQSTHIEFHCKILDMNFRCAYMTQATFGSFAEWAIVSSAPLFVSGWSAYKHAISTNTTKWHPQTTTETLSYNRKVTSCKEAYCIPTAKAMRDIKQWQGTLQQTPMVRFYFNTFKSKPWVIWIWFIWHTSLNLNS